MRGCTQAQLPTDHLWPATSHGPPGPECWAADSQPAPPNSWCPRPDCLEPRCLGFLPYKQVAESQSGLNVSLRRANPLQCAARSWAPISWEDQRPRPSFSCSSQLYTSPFPTQSLFLNAMWLLESSSPKPPGQASTLKLSYLAQQGS